MKKLRLFIMALAVGTVGAFAQVAEAGPAGPAPNGNTPDALFDLQYIIDVGVNGSIGAQSQAGVAFINNEWWVSTWNTDQIHILDAAGAFIQTIVVPGVTGTRSLTTDGTNLYLGTAGLNIFEVDPVAMTVSNTINITTGSSASARMVTYDETLDGGNGGFWIGNFGSDIASVDMSGNELSVIGAGTHGTTIYGGAVDNVSAGGPFLWIHDQNGVAPSRDFVVQLELPSGTPTGVVYDFTADGASAGATDVLAGGLFITDEVDPAMWQMIGLCQCTPSNLIFGLELLPIAGVGDNTLTDFSIAPNPANGSTVTINTGIQAEMQVAVFDVLGKQVINTVLTNNELSVEGLNAGVYMVQVTQQGNTAVKKLVVK